MSLASGAIKGWDRRNAYYFAMLESLASHYKFDIEQAFESLPDPVQHAVLHGSGEQEIKFSYTLDSGAETLISRNSVLITVEPLKKQETEVE